MKTYRVEVQRTSYIDIEVEAETEADAGSKAIRIATQDYSDSADYEVSEIEELP